MVIEVKDLHREYITYSGWIKRKKKHVKAVDGINFSVDKGEIFGLLGQNGAGKTTTIKMLTTLLAPTSGTCKVLGHDSFNQAKKIRPQINFIFGGELGLYRRLSGRDNLKYFSNLYLIDSQIANKRIEELLRLVGLSDKADLLVETYSKGMTQRMQIARGLLNNPEIIFMDEPTVGLDPLGAKMLRDIIKSIKSLGKTVLLTTHYMYEADELCDRIGLMKEGKLVIIDTPSNLKKRIGGSNTIEIVVKNISSSQINEISKFDGIDSISSENTDEGTLLKIQHSSAIDVYQDVLTFSRGLHVISFTRKEQTLEDVYIKLVGDNI